MFTRIDVVLLLVPDRHERLEQHRRDSAKGTVHELCLRMFWPSVRIGRELVQEKGLKTVWTPFFCSGGSGTLSARGLYGQGALRRALARQEARADCPGCDCLILYGSGYDQASRPLPADRRYKTYPPADLNSQPSPEAFPCFFRPLPLRLRPPRLLLLRRSHNYRDPLLCSTRSASLISWRRSHTLTDLNNFL